MKEDLKNELLKQVGTVLQFCQEIVSKLSSPQCCNHNTSEYESLVNLSDIMTKTFVSDCDSQYELSTRSSSESSTPLQKWPTYHNITEAEAAEDPWMSETTTLAVTEYERMQRSAKTDNVLMQSVVKFLNVVTPDAIYHPNWREEQKRKAIHPEFYNLWKSYDAIFSDAKDDSVDIKVPAPDNIYHTIDIFNVNSRFIENIPKPNSYPVLGVSQDPDFYHKRYDRGDPTKCFLSSYPHGALSGYETNIGIVAPPTEPVHGYIWSDRYRSYVLHAVRPGEGSSSSRRRRG